MLKEHMTENELLKEKAELDKLLNEGECSSTQAIRIMEIKKCLAIINKAKTNYLP